MTETRTLKFLDPIYRKENSHDLQFGRIMLNSRCISILDYNKAYIKVPGCPPSYMTLTLSGFTPKEAETAWLAFWKNVDKCKSEQSCQVSFSPCKEKCFNVKNGFVSIATPEAILVLRDFSIRLSLLHNLGYEVDYNLPVPFSKQEAYYDVSLDTNPRFRQGLIIPC